MSEEDFVFAWMLAARVGSTDHWTAAATYHQIVNAKETYKQIKQECKDETDSRTED